MKFSRVFYLTLLGVLLLTGCDEQKDTRIHISLWQQRSGTERDIFNKRIAQYSANHPEVSIVTLFREGEEMRNLFIIAAVAGQGPDIIYGVSDNVGVFETTKTILPIDQILPADFLAGFTPEGVVSWKGHPWLVADQLGNQLSLVCNLSEITQAPRTLDELITVGKRLTRDTNGDGTPDHYGLNWNYREPYFFIPFLTAFGGWVMDEKGHPSFDNPQTVAALQFILDLRDKHKIIPKEGDYEIAEMLYKEGRTAMIINGPWAWADYGVPTKSAVFPLPINSENGLACASMVAAKGYCVNINLAPEKKAAVRDLIMFLTNSETQTILAAKAFTFPTRKDVLNSRTVLDSPTLMASLEQIRRSRSIPIQPQMRQIWDGMRGPYQLVMSGAVTAKEGARLMQLECEKKIADSNL